MTLDVVVTDKSGAPLEGLSAADFKLLDNKTPQNILSVRATEGFAAKPDPPVEVIVVLDAINSSFLTETNARKWIRDFLDENGGQLALPTSLLVLTDHGAKAQDHPSRDGKILEQFLDANNPGLRTMKKDQGWEGAMAREQASLKLLNLLATGEARVPGRKLLLWLSPGWQMISQSMSSRSQKSNNLLFDYIVSISTELRAARITLYNINPQEAGPGQYQFESYLKPVDVPEHSDFGNLLLPVLAEETGGQVMAGYNDLAKLMDRCIADAKDYYELTFTPPPPGHPNELHKLEVLVDKPGLKAEARTRTLYYAEPTTVTGAGSSASAPGQTPKPASN
jgi:VWFA-related protein